MKEQKEENELLKIWKYQLYNGYVSYRRFFRGNILSFWRLKAEMDAMKKTLDYSYKMTLVDKENLRKDALIITDLKKQIIGFAKDNALLHQKLKKCKERTLIIDAKKILKEVKGEKRG